MSGGDGLMPREGETHLFDHAIVSLRRLALGRQIVTDENRVRGVEAQRLEAAEVQFAAAGDPQFAGRIDKAKHGERLKAISRREAVASSERRAGNIDQEVEWDRFDFQLAEGER